MPTDALLQIEEYFLAFQQKVFACRDSASHCPHELMDAYSRLARLRERYLREEDNITPSEKCALERVFVEDTFTEGMMHMRNIADHVVSRSQDRANIRTPNREPITLDVETSAGQLFSSHTVCLPIMQNINNGPTEIEINHIDWLTNLAGNIQRAIGRAKSASQDTR